MENKIVCMCEFEPDKILEQMTNTHIIDILINSGLKMYDIVMTIWLNETTVDIFNFDYLVLKYLPVFIVDLNINKDVIDSIQIELEKYISWYLSVIPEVEYVTELSDYKYYEMCCSMEKEIREQWLISDK